MVDYSEGYLNLKRLVSDFWDAVLTKDYDLAKSICDCIVVEARLTKAKVGSQVEEQR